MLALFFIIFEKLMNKTSNLFSIGITIIFIIISFLQYRNANNIDVITGQIRELEIQRFLMLSKAEELRQSSDDLTRFARQYVITGNLVYKKNYFDILAIRNGEKARPQNYHQIYWDLPAPLRNQRHPLDKTTSLKNLIGKHPFSAQELAKLEESEFNSNELVNIEVEAFKAMEGAFKDMSGEYLMKELPDQKFAINLLFSMEYEQAKQNIMLPIDEFLNQLDTRLENQSNELQGALRNNFRKSYTSQALSVLLFITVLIMFYYLLHRDYKTISQLALTDDLTKISNRRAFMVSSKDLLALARSNNGHLSLLMLDIDYFKKINDTHGHLIGDKVLQHLVRVTKHCLRNTDIFCRWGGEEFAILLPDIDEENALLAAERIRKAVESDIFIQGGVCISYSISIGVSEHCNDKSIETWLLHADEALYKAKNSGRNIVVAFSSIAPLKSIL